MADEVIKIIEYITGNPIVQGAAIGYVVFVAIVALIALAIIVYVFHNIVNMGKRWRR